MVAREFFLYDMDEHIRHEINKTCEEVERRLNRESLGTALYYSVMELISNGVKANLKRLYFSEKGYYLEDPESYRKGMQEFKEDLKHLKKQKLTAELKKNKLHVRVLITLNHTGLQVEVENNSPLLREEFDRINEKLDQSLRMEDIMDFYKSNQDDIEGKGLGILLILQLWRPYGMKSTDLIIHNRKESTIVRMHIPVEGILAYESGSSLLE